MNWYYAKNNDRLGPVQADALDELVRSGEIGSNSLVWTEGMTDWLPYSQARHAAGSLSATDAYCVECGNSFPKTEMIRHGDSWVCASCKPIFLQKISEGVAIAPGMHYAGFWIRVLAKFLDGIVLAIVCFAPLFIIIFAMGLTNNPSPKANDTLTIIQLIWQVLYYIIWAAYSIFFTGKFGATPGKMVCGIKVVDASGAKIGYGRATGRFFAEILSALICYIGYLMVAFDDEKRGLHDRICNTRAIYK